MESSGICQYMDIAAGLGYGPEYYPSDNRRYREIDEEGGHIAGKVDKSGAIMVDGLG